MEDELPRLSDTSSLQKAIFPFGDRFNQKQAKDEAFPDLIHGIVEFSRYSLLQTFPSSY